MSKKKIKKHPLETNYKEKCDTCSKDKPLDSMVRKDYTKGLYECTDCKVEHEWLYRHKNYDELLTRLDKPLVSRPSSPSTTSSTSRVRKVVTWITG